ncbi:hypothetical protein ACWDTI_19800 [Gordonia sp. NPDC003424]
MTRLGNALAKCRAETAHRDQLAPIDCAALEAHLAKAVAALTSGS